MRARPAIAAPDRFPGRHVVKKLLVIVGLIVAVLVGAVAVGILFIDGIARAAIERGGNYALQVETRVASVDVGLTSGEFAMSGLTVANPDGFDAPRFLELGSGGMSVSLGTLRSDVVEIPRIALDDLGVVLERRGGRSNYGTIVDNLRRLSAETGEEPPAEEPPLKEGKTFVVDEVVVSNIAVTVDFVPQGGELTTVDVAIDEVRVTDIGKGGQDPVAMAELVGIIVQAVLQAVADKGGGIVPVDILQDLEGQLDRLPSLASSGVGMAVELSEETQRAIEEGLQGAEEAARGIGRELERAGEDLEKGLGGLLPGRGGSRGGGDGGADGGDG